MFVLDVGMQRVWTLFVAPLYISDGPAVGGDAVAGAAVAGAAVGGAAVADAAATDAAAMDAVVVDAVAVVHSSDTVVFAEGGEAPASANLV